MPSSLTSNERFLADFHDQRAGVTSQAFMSLRATKQGEVAASSYDFLAALVPKENSPLTVLDVACGDGYLLWLVASSRQRPATLMGVDISQGELTAARRRLGQSATLIQGRAQALPLPEGSADFVLCHMALMLMDDLDSVITEVRRVLRSGGVFSFIVGAKPPPSAALDLYLSQLRVARRRLNSTIPSFGDPRLSEPGQIQQLLTNRFDDVLVEEVSISRRYSPSDIWSWFEGMYDLHGIPPHEQTLMKQDYIAALSPLCEEDGCLEFTDNLRQVRAIATSPQTLCPST